MNLLELTNLKEKTASINHQRQDQAHKYYERAVEYFKQAALYKFTEKDLIKKSLQQFILAVQNNRRHIEAYMGLSTLMIILQQPVNAIKCLKTILTIDPDYTPAQELMQYVQTNMPSGSKENTQPESTLLGLELPLEDSTEQHYEQTEQLIIQQTHQQMTQPIIMVDDTFDEFQYQRIQAQFRDLEQIYTKIWNDIEKLSSQLDVSLLRVKFRPLEQIYTKLLDIRNYAEQVLGLKQTIAQTQQNCLNLLEYYQHEQLHMTKEDEFEKLLDQCDWLADQIDLLQETKHNTQFIEAHYHELIKHVEFLQDVIDS